MEPISEKLISLPSIEVEAHTPEMDLLSKAYATASDDEDGGGGVAGTGSRHSHPPPPPKRVRGSTSFPNSSQMSVFRLPNFPAEAPIPGSYISKRQRALVSDPTLSEPNPPHADPSPVLGSLSDSDLPQCVFTALRRRSKNVVVSNQTPQSLSAGLRGHTKAVNSMQWSKSHVYEHLILEFLRFHLFSLSLSKFFPAHLLASAGMDHTVRIWNVWSTGQKQARVFNNHHAAVKDVKWSEHGLSVLSCGYDCTSRLVDVEKGMEVKVFKENQIVEVVKFCPDNYNLFLSGGSKGQLKLWDIRTGIVVHEYVRNLGPILDVEFTVDGKYLITSSDVSKTNLSENSILVWDVSRQVPLSNQVYAEAFTCPCIRCHPFEPYFIAQSNGNYIAIFSTRPPFKLDKYKRYESHGVSGFPIKCNFSPDGNMVASGSSDGCIFYFDSKSSKFLKKVKVYEQACIDVVFHPYLHDVIASCSWNGEVSVLQPRPR
ncbi:transducin/WD40 repeat-like superfamily protein [Striga asiatica]|uniref:Transducin/WD40 repeat-like superfamily protein n=1 Tax=Striga asiatica TaxID=4170 RepID=A0A5A7QTQ7_STRAF|nr:transducin/WD40 repeat-like superfamily protein [Striga asiatica]